MSKIMLKIAEYVTIANCEIILICEAGQYKKLLETSDV